MREHTTVNRFSEFVFKTALRSDLQPILVGPLPASEPGLQGEDILLDLFWNCLLFLGNEICEILRGAILNWISLATCDGGHSGGHLLL
jgi:hypothetical protein